MELLLLCSPCVPGTQLRAGTHSPNDRKAQLRTLAVGRTACLHPSTEQSSFQGLTPRICSGHHQLSTQTIFSSCWAHSQPNRPCPWLCHVTELSQWGVSESRICPRTVWPFGPSHVWNRTRDHHEGMGRSTGTGVETVHDKLKRHRQVSSCTSPVGRLPKVAVSVSGCLYRK